MRNSTHTGRRSTTGLTSILLVTLIGLSACAAGEDESSSAAQAGTATTAAAATDQAGAIAAAAEIDGEVSLEPGTDAIAVGPATGAPEAGVALPDATPFGSALAITAGVTVEVPDVRQAVIDLPELVTAKGGAIFDTDIAVGDPETATATITVKVPPAEMESLIAGLGGLGELVGRTQQTEDVADQIADTEARIQTARASVDRVRTLLEQAVTLDDVVRIESELTVRETALEQLLAGQRNLADRVQLATLTIVITPAIADEPVAAVKKSTGIGDALRTGWNTFTDVVHGTAVVVAYSAPLLVIGLLGGLALLFLRRRLHRSPRQSTVIPQ